MFSLDGVSHNHLSTRLLVTRFITVKVRIIGLGRTHVEPKGRVGQDLDPMALHGALVEGGLPIENDAIVILHLALHNIPEVENLI